MFFLVDLFSEDFHTVMDKLGILNVSINVDSAYWKDVRDNLTVDKDNY